MGKKLLFIGLALGLALSTVMPGSVLAAKPTPKFEDFTASGGINYITPGTVFPAGASGRFAVQERELGSIPGYGGALVGSIAGDYTLTYKANVELATQAGNLHGRLNTGSYSLEVNGKIEPLEFYGWYLEPGISPYYPNGIPLYYLEINGRWTFVNGAQGNGDFTAWVVFIPTPEGHVYAITASSFDMTGKWKP